MNMTSLYKKTLLFVNTILLLFHKLHRISKSFSANNDLKGRLIFATDKLTLNSLAEK